jgi:hypothetical protein
VATKIAFVKAATNGGTPGSPTPEERCSRRCGQWSGRALR